MILLHTGTRHCSSLVTAFPAPMSLQDSQETVTITKYYRKSVIHNPVTLQTIKRFIYVTRASERMDINDVILSTNPPYCIPPFCKHQGKLRMQTQTNNSQIESDEWLG
jgi:hypothetical protein